MIESNDIWSVLSYIWNWCQSTVWYEGEIFGVRANWTIADFFIYPLIACVFIFVIRLVFWLADDE